MRFLLTNSGKVDRRALPAPEPGQEEREEAYVAPRSVVEEMLASIWSEVLGRSEGRSQRQLLRLRWPFAVGDTGDVAGAASVRDRDCVAEFVRATDGGVLAETIAEG